jgi:hypothetical protein
LVHLPPPAGIYSSILSPSACILELCASRYSHLPDGFVQRLVVGQGMNSSELAANPSLHQHFVQVSVCGTSDGFDLARAA